MAIAKIKNLGEIERYLEGTTNQKAISLLSFDIFDTIVFRKVPDKAIIHASCKWLLKRLNLFDKTIDEILSARQNAYNKVSEDNKFANSDKDATLKEFAYRWITDLIGFESTELLSVAEALVEYEISLECNLSYVEKSTVELLKRLKKKYKLVYCSDMYLSKALIDRLLDFHGLGDIFSFGYVSADLRKFKWSGKLYKQMIKDENISAESIVHIGDNRYSDGKIASRNKLNAVIVENNFNWKRKDNLVKLYDLSLRDKNTTANLNDFICKQGLMDVEGKAQVFGFESVAPLFVSFVFILCENLKKKKIKKLYFVARDGLIFKKIYDLLSPLYFAGSKAPESHYLKISRQSVFAATQKSIDLAKLKEWVKQNEGKFTLADCLKRYGIIDYEKVSEVSPDLNAPLYPDDLNNREIIEFLSAEKLNKEIAESCENRKHNLELYLEGEEFFCGEEIALVDIGWSGSAQSFLYDIFRQRKDFPKINGYYFALKNEAQKHVNERSSFEALICDESGLGFFSSAAFSFLHCLELLCSAPHATVIDYTDKGEAVLMDEANPVRVAEKRNDRIIAKIHHAVLLYAEKLGYVYGVSPTEAEAFSAFARTVLHRLVRHPSKEEASLLLSLEFSESFGKETVDRVGTDFSEENIFTRLSALVNKKYRQASWGRGVVESLRIPLLGPLYSLGGAYKQIASKNNLSPADSLLREALRLLSMGRFPKVRKNNHSLVAVDSLNPCITADELELFEAERLLLNSVLKAKGLATFKRDGL